VRSLFGVRHHQALERCVTHRLQENLKAGLDSDKEQDLLRQWHEMQQD
jgi:hypothetical protein